jgi:peptidoglycan/LPS O-acetylase OafA/YrhL
VLSGFLITGILFDAIGSRNLFKNFFLRRALRLYPAYIVLLCIVLTMDRATPHFFGVAISYLLYFPNLVRPFYPLIFSLSPMPTHHLWSLAVEEQFYLVWPWIVVGLGNTRRILSVCLYGSIAALLLRLVLVAGVPHLDLLIIYCELPTRADAFLIGAAVAMLVRDRELIAQINLNFVRLLGLMTLTACVAMASFHSFSFENPVVATVGYTLTALGSACLILLALAPTTWTARAFSNPVLGFFGRYSYGIYLYHFPPALYYERYLFPAIVQVVHSALAAKILLSMSILAFSTGAAVVSFRIIEKPFLLMKRRFAFSATAGDLIRS